MNSSIHIRGARQHNLKNLDIEIPRDQLVVVTGPSGSGKSSLAFNTLYAEGQRRYVESLSAYARQFLDQLEKPDVDFIEGLSPAIAIEQRSSAPNPRSIIATVTEIYDYLRVLYSALGQPHDPATGEAVTKMTPAQIVDAILSAPERTRVILLAPVVDNAVSDPKATLERLKRNGFVRARIDGEILELDEELPRIDRKARHSIEAVVDRLVIKEGVRTRLAGSVETGLRWGNGDLRALVQPPGADDWRMASYTTAFANPKTGFRMAALTPRHFSFNSHLGACPACHGLGSILRPDPALFVPDPDKSLAEGAVRSWWSRNKKLKALHDRQLAALADHFGIDLATPWNRTTEEFRAALFEGTGDEAVKTGWKTGATTRSVEKPFEGLLVQAERLHDTSKSETTRRNVRRFMNPRPCRRCEGRRLRPEILGVTLGGLAIDQFTAMAIGDALKWLKTFKPDEAQAAISAELLREISKRLEFLDHVGLSYLTLDRESGTLSGGEAQRIRLATQIGAGLAGVLYVLDEPSIGLHQHDNARLIETLKDLRDLGNTVIVVEHDADTIEAADHVLDFGPAAGPRGGELVAQGTAEQIKAHGTSITGKYLSGRLEISIPKRRPTPAFDSALRTPNSALDSGWITIHGAREHNLQGIDASFPVGCITCVTGMSGSGKSTLVDDIFRRVLFRRFHGSKEAAGAHDSVSGLDQFDKAIVIDQSPIGRSPRSNPVTYAGAFTPIRALFAQLPSAKVRGYDAGRFSFNVKGGRCEHCQGDGSIRIDMHFLSDVYVTCEECGGKRYNRDTLDITFKGKNIAEILAMSIDEATRFFARVPKVYAKLRSIGEVGLGYLKLGQAANTLSGGEAQRVKLAAELGKRSTGDTLYLLDEPTTGLHFQDIETLLGVLYRLRDAGNTLVVIEHNLDVIKCADHILDLGPGGGPNGGRIVAQGTPEEVAKVKESVTGRYLAKVL